MSEWQPIETAPSLERIIVAGWQPEHGAIKGYWWWYEDHTNEHGKPIDFPSALKWHKPIPVPSESPDQIKATA